MMVPNSGKGALVDTKVDPALARLGESTDRALATADRLTDAQASAPACCPAGAAGMC